MLATPHLTEVKHRLLRVNGYPGVLRGFARKFGACPPRSPSRPARRQRPRKQSRGLLVPPVSPERLLEALGAYEAAREDAIAANAAAVMKTAAKVEALKLERGVVLGGKKPVDGGPVAVYKVQRRRRATGEWVDVGTSVGRQIALSDQETGVELEFRVSAINKAGEGRPSKSVAAGASPPRPTGLLVG